MSDSDLGSARRRFKLTTADNWLDPDPLCTLLYKLDHRDGSVSPMDGRDWINYVNRIPLGGLVPQEVRDAYEFPRGAVGYGYFYYPLFTLVMQQMLRVADFAVQRLFELRDDLPKPRRQNFDSRLRVLRDSGFLTGGSIPEVQAQTREPGSFTRWDAIRRLRNSATHPEWQQTWGHNLEQIRNIAELLSTLPWPNK